MTIELSIWTLSGLLWLLWLLGFLFGAFWAGRARDDSEGRPDPLDELTPARDDAIDRLLQRNREARRP